ncbi:zinc metalloprotease [Lacinutrix sp. MEBiC02404]
MKKLVYFLLVLTLFFQCKNAENRKSLENEINKVELKGIDSTTYEEIYTISENYEIEDLSPKIEKSEVQKNSFKSILNYEKTTLKQWVALPEYMDSITTFSSTDNTNIVRCATIDRASKKAKRTPVSNVEKKNSFFLFGMAKIHIPIHVHVINNNFGYMFKNDSQLKSINASVTESQINKQIQVLNNEFNKFNISFELTSIDSINNTKWNVSGAKFYSDKLHDDMVYDLAKEPETHMNLYIINGRNNGSLLGEASFPWDDSSSRYDDYVVINCRTIPGVYEKQNYINNQGKTLIHEVGHYLGLWHTFHGRGDCKDIANNGCYWGDRVTDTPAQNVCYDEFCDCNGKPCDSCLDDPGNDPNDNYMGYIPDNCMDNFTTGQISRIFKSVYFHRETFFYENSLDEFDFIN